MEPNERLSKWLEETATTRAALARHLGVHRSEVTRILSAARRPTLARAAAIESITAGWRFGPIRAVEWAHAKTASASR